jgi:hypothetical protein
MDMMQPSKEKNISVLVIVNFAKIIQKPSLHLIVRGRLFCYAFSRKGGDFLTIEEYIKSKENFSLMPFTTVYLTIMELINDGFIEQSAFEKGGGTDVAIPQPKPERKVCRRLYDQGDFHSNR